MTWTVDEIVRALKSNDYPNMDTEEELALQLFNSEKVFGVGVDGKNRRVLILPGQQNSASFSTRNAAFDSWGSVKWVGSDVDLPRVATLRCEANFRNQAICEAVAVIFVGLIDLQERYGSAGAAIWELKELFENGFVSRVSQETIVGLFGELLLINSSSDPDRMIEIWHSGEEDSFDFSTERHRLEVKTSRSRLRNHRFSSNQIGTELDVKTTVASLILNIVEEGTSIDQLVQMIEKRVTVQNRVKLVNVAVATLGITPESITAMKIDVGSSIENIIFVSAADVPRPLKSPGVLSMNWVASLDNCPTSHGRIASLIPLF